MRQHGAQGCKPLITNINKMIYKAWLTCNMELSKRGAAPMMQGSGTCKYWLSYRTSSAPCTSASGASLSSPILPWHCEMNGRGACMMGVAGPMVPRMLRQKLVQSPSRASPRLFTDRIVSASGPVAIARCDSASINLERFHQWNMQ